MRTDNLFSWTLISTIIDNLYIYFLERAFQKYCFIFLRNGFGTKDLIQQINFDIPTDLLCMYQHSLCEIKTLPASSKGLRPPWSSRNDTEYRSWPALWSEFHSGPTWRCKSLLNKPTNTGETLIIVVLYCRNILTWCACLSQI